MVSQTIILLGIIAFIGLVMVLICKSKSSFGSMSESEQPNISRDSVLIFIAPWCGHCQRSKDDFEKAVQKGGGDIYMIDATKEDNKKLVDKYKINSFPTIIRGDGTKYNGKDRGADEIIAFKDKK